MGLHQSQVAGNVALVCMCAGEVGAGHVIIPNHVSLFMIHAMTSSAITTVCLGEPWGRKQL